MNFPRQDLRPSVALARDLVPLPLAIGLCTVMAAGFLIYRLANLQPAEEVGAVPNGPPQAAPAELVVPLLVEQRQNEPRAPSLMADTPPTAPELERPDPPSAPPTCSLPSYLPEPIQPPVDYIPTAPSNNTSGTPIVIDLSRDRRGLNSDNDPENFRGRQEPARAEQIRNRISTIPQGAIIAAVLETPLNSDRPGLARAIISQDVRGFDGTRVLIPRGSRLVGEFQIEVTPGLRRIPVIWNRLIRPDGVAINIASPGGDPLGGAGIGGRVNTHFGQRLLNAVFQSALSVGVNVLSRSPSNDGNAIFVGLPGTAQQAVVQLIPNTDRPPTVKVREGAEISVIVGRDLDFSGMPAVR